MLSGLTAYLPETALTVFDNLEFFIRIVLAAVLGALVGLERSKRQKEAGVRTHCIIACTSALFMILSKYAFVDLVSVDGLRGADPARIAAQVVSGISFLGAGVIFKNGNSIRGLTTAAGMWGTAAVGMAIGAGLYWVGLIETAVLVALVGLERSKRQKEAGVRTHCIIACTSALFMILSKYAFVDLVSVDGLRGADPARIAAQVVSGISFLGAGVIFKNGNSIRGLTTAAGMWGTAAVGMAIGAGLYWVGLIETAVLVVIQIVFHRFPVGADALTTQELVVEMADSDELLARFDELVKAHRGQITESSLARENGILRMEVTAKLDPPISHEEALAFMKANDGVRRVSV